MRWPAPRTRLTGFGGYARLPAEMDKSFRSVPSVDRVLSDGRIQHLEKVYARPFLLRAIRQRLEEVRLAIAEGEAAPSFDEIAESVCGLVESMAQPSLRPVINATGVVLHTNLGRAPLSREATAAMEECARGYVNLEIDSETGKRGSRQVHVE